LLIRINTRTVRRNPNAGRQYYLKATGRTVTLKYCCPAESTWDPPDGFRVHRWQRFDVAGESARVELVATAASYDLGALAHWVKGLLAAGGVVVDLSVDYHYQRLHTLRPEGAWLYAHEDPILTCHACNGPFKRKELKADSCGYGDGEVWSNTICPLCGEWDCVALEFEQLTNTEMQALADKNEETRS